MRTRILLFGIVLLECIGCSEYPGQPLPLDAIGIAGRVSDHGSREKTKTSVGSNGSTVSFASGDRIGIFETSLTNRSNVLFSFNGSAWSTAATMYWYNSSSVHSFYAYYPYNASSQGSVVAMPVLSTQQVSTAIDATRDMLVTGLKQQARSAGTTVNFTFGHAFTLLQLNITMGILNTYTLKTMTLRGGNVSGGSAPYGLVNITGTPSLIGYNLATGAVQASANDNTSYSQTMISSIPSVGLLGSIPVTVYALVLPGLYQNPVPAIRFNIAPLIGNSKDSEYANLFSTNTTLLANTKYTFNVKIGGGILTKAARPADSAGPTIAVELESADPIP